MELKDCPVYPNSETNSCGYANLCSGGKVVQFVAVNGHRVSVPVESLDKLFEEMRKRCLSGFNPEPLLRKEIGECHRKMSELRSEVECYMVDAQRLRRELSSANEAVAARDATITELESSDDADADYGDDDDSVSGEYLRGYGDGMLRAFCELKD